MKQTRSSLRETALLLSLGAVGLGFSLATGGDFLTSRNLSQLLIEYAITATLAVGMLLVILPGHIDLSAGSGVGLTGGIAAVLITQQQWPAPAAMAAGLAVALALWAAMGTLVVREGIPAFIVTLGGLQAFKGLFWKVIENKTIPVAQGGTSNALSLLTTTYLPGWLGWTLAGMLAAGLGWAGWRDRSARAAAGLPVETAEMWYLRSFVTAQVLGLLVLVCNRYQGVPVPLVILGAMAFGVHFLVQHTPFGRSLVAIGGNAEAALLSGIRVKRVTLAAFVLMGAGVALTGMLQTAYAGYSTTDVGNLLELDAVAACVIGGVSLRGGRGGVGGVLIGALLMAVLGKGMSLLGTGPEAKYMVRGAVLVTAVWLDLRMGAKH
jgi:D-xylose transport system permease protein